MTKIESFSEMPVGLALPMAVLTLVFASYFAATVYPLLFELAVAISLSNTTTVWSHRGLIAGILLMSLATYIFGIFFQLFHKRVIEVFFGR